MVCLNKSALVATGLVHTLVVPSILSIVRAEALKELLVYTCGIEGAPILYRVAGALGVRNAKSRGQQE